MRNYKHVLVLYVGGTIGMQRNSKGALIPVRNAFLEKVKHHSDMHDVEQAEKFDRPLKENELILPPYKAVSVLYKIEEYDPLLDSSNMSCRDWIKIAKDIGGNYNDYDGFVVLHGTDTMAYTSSALSFMLEGIRKPVIVTGSQISIFETGSDAKDNFLSSLIIAGCYTVPEVCIFFANKLLRGNRTKKVNSEELDAFASPNYYTLADVGLGVDVKMYYQYIRKPDKTSVTVHTNLNSNASILTFCPTMTSQMLESFLKPPLKGLVIQTYGAGNLPTQKDILDVIKKAVEQEILIINVTQCSRGAVNTNYETGKDYDEIGLVSGTDMTVEAALTKLIYILGLPKLTYEERIELMRTDLRGELSNSNT